ncbi:MAG: pyroglutamyl-peptidase I [Lachnospiraceae bacterium]|nr:pyroglutamyl-peptidase I [Lachnospiraceae bacterium]
MILFTGFEPFDNGKSNPSFEAVKLLPDRINGVQVEKLELPVVFGEASETIIKRLEVEIPDAIIMTGLAAGREAITPEVVAINLADARIPDNAGNEPKWARIIQDGPDGLFSTLPVKQMVSDMEAAGLKASLSYSAGTYVCNDTFYRVCNYIRAKAPKVPCGFIHVPAPKGMDKGTEFTLEDFAKAFEICASAALKKALG